MPGRRADARGAGPPALPRVRPARPAVDRVGGPAVRGRRLHPRRPADPAGVDGRHASPSWPTRPSDLVSTAVRAGRRAPRRTTRPSSTSTCTGPTAPESADEASEQLRRAGRGAARSPATYAGSRSPSAPAASRPVGYFTFRPDQRRRAWSRTTSIRGVHPMVGRRLNLWRLRNFDVTRLEAPEDVLLYECVARENPADRRLVALAQVRQLAVVRDERRPGHRAAARRACGRELPRGDPAGPGGARRRRRASST